MEIREHVNEVDHNDSDNIEFDGGECGCRRAESEANVPDSGSGPAR